ncbi:MAG: type 1 glutamine amidotransferase domain-containing protein [Rhodospirillaceae bacterium]|nr:type 1 glutamine amidotransferase domain-containing protein [Rhodospirillaceae bacterium]
MRLLMVLTSHERLGATDKKTGLWFEEFAGPYYAFLDAGAEIALATPKGGYAPVDPESDGPASGSVSLARFRHDRQARAALNDTLQLAQIHAEDFSGAFYPGGHGSLWDLAADPCSITLIKTLHAAGKPAAFLCHGVAALLNTSLVNGKHVTGYSNAEVTHAGLNDVLPFALEDELKKRGGLYSSRGIGQPHVVRDGALITGQNHASTAETAAALLAALR